MQVFMNANRFNNDPRYSVGVTVEIEPTAEVSQLLQPRCGRRAGPGKEALDMRRLAWCRGLVPASELPAEMFPSIPRNQRDLCKRWTASMHERGRPWSEASPNWAGRQKKCASSLYGALRR